MSSTAVYDAVGSVLAAAAESMATLGKTPTAYVSHGDPAADCDQLTAQWSNLDATQQIGGGPTGTPNPADRRMPRVLTFDFAVVRWQCVPAITESKSGTPILPTPAAMDASALDLAQEAWVVWNDLRDAMRAGAILGDRCRLAQIGPVRPLNPEGGLGGWRILGSAEISGEAA